MQFRTQLWPWQEISIDGTVHSDDACIFDRSDTGDRLQPISGCEKTNKHQSKSMGNAKGTIPTHTNFLMGMALSIHGKRGASGYLVEIRHVPWCSIDVFFRSSKIFRPLEPL
jgi:hypothetical protein